MNQEEQRKTVFEPPSPEEVFHDRLKEVSILSIEVESTTFIESIVSLSTTINIWMKHQGFWASDNKAEKIALMHSELSECLEAVRKGDKENEAEELADTVIRILDYAAHHKMNLGQAIIDKMRYNFERPFRHGKKF